MSLEDAPTPPTQEGRACDGRRIHLHKSTGPAEAKEPLTTQALTHLKDCAEHRKSRSKTKTDDDSSGVRI